MAPAGLQARALALGETLRERLQAAEAARPDSPRIGPARAALAEYDRRAGRAPNGDQGPASYDDATLALRVGKRLLKFKDDVQFLAALAALAPETKDPKGNEA